MTTAIHAEGLCKRFGDTQALGGVSLDVQPGTVLGLLGPNGAGKTTVVRILSTLLHADAGTATVGGFDVHTQAHQVRQLIGLTGQYASVDERLTGRENLVLIGRLLGLPRRTARERADALLAQFQLEHAATRAAQTYSGGMRRRLDLAASLVGQPRILFLDEPTTGLDPRARLELWGLIRRLVAEGTTVLLTTQYLEEADQLADEIVVIDGGQVIASGTADALKARIGARTLVASATREADIAPIAAAISRITGETPEVDGLRVSAPARDADMLPAVVRTLDRDGLAVNELMLRSASLDDVFLALTGRHADADDAVQPTGTEHS
ncbi:ATP-binding cassette domain-containing protein [Aquisalimonas asiatica]|uniref:Oleandomycin transport system ATP-binding protein n=1 Tax=Aquisalimonas asiatica TaxID=406100 RepID=A0A1H8V0W3_9GAMM|nr:ATP-binding cassette domain-containing protein [Aquisalimonas asiatica]SEP08873.1 oleandomycin transport system ATP-binding protein [Aquisalimonas asiatica]